MAQQLFSFRRFVQVQMRTPGARVQVFGSDTAGRLYAGEIVAAQDRQVIANLLVDGTWIAAKLETYGDGSMPDFTVQPVASVFIVTILPWDVYKVERFDEGTRWVPATYNVPGAIESPEGLSIL